MLLLRALVARFWREPYRGQLDRVGHGAARPVAAAAFRRRRHARRRRRPAARRLSVRDRVVRAVRRVPLPALRHGRRTTASRSSCGRRSSRGTCSARRSATDRHRALCRFVGRAAAGQGDRHDRRSPRRHVQRPRRAADGRPAFPANSSPACAFARGVRRPRCIRRSACRRRCASISSTAGRSARSAAARITSRIPAAATTTRSRSTPTKPKRGGSRASGRTATRPVRSTCTTSRAIRRCPRRSTCAGIPDAGGSCLPPHARRRRAGRHCSSL